MILFSFFQPLCGFTKRKPFNRNYEEGITSTLHWENLDCFTTEAVQQSTCITWCILSERNRTFWNQCPSSMKSWQNNVCLPNESWRGSPGREEQEDLQLTTRLAHLRIKPTITSVTSWSSRGFFRHFNRFYPFIRYITVYDVCICIFRV